MCRHLSSLLGQSPQTHLHLTPEPRPAGRLPTTLPECPSSFPGAQGALNRTQWGVSERGYAGPHPPFVPNRPVYLAHVQTPGPFSGFSMSLLAGPPVSLGIRAWGFGSWEADPQLLLWRLRTAGGARAQGSAPCPGPAFLTTPVPRWLDAAPQ